MEGPRAGKVGAIVAFLALVFLVGLVYLPLLLGQVLYQRDISRWVYPEHAFLSSSFARSDSPLWNPLIGLGLSTLANPLNQMFYPPNILLLALHSPWVTSFFFFAHILFGATGMLVLVRRLSKGSAIPALVAALAWGLSAYTTSEVTAGLLLIASAYIPWCALGVLGLSRTICEAGTWRACIGAAGRAAIPFGLCFLTGEIFFVFFAATFAFGVAIGDRLQRGMAKPASLCAWAWRLMLGFCSAVVLASALAAVMLLPVKHAAQASDRATPLARETAEVGSFHPWRLAEMIAPGAMGDPYAAYPAGSWVGERELGDRPLLYGCYLGSSVLLLALMAFGRGRRLANTLGVVAVLALLVALGRHTGVHALVRVLIPPLAYMRGPEKYLSVLVACVSLLAGLGAARLLESSSRNLWLRGLLVAAALMALALGASWFPLEMVQQIQSSAMAGLAVALAATAVVWLASRSARLAGLLLIGVVWVDLAPSIFALQNFGPADLLAAKPNAATAVLADTHLHGTLAPPRVYRSEVVDAAIEAVAPPTSVAQVQRNLVGTLIDNHAGSFGIATVPGYDAALPATLSSLWRSGRAAGLDLFRLTGVEYVIFPSSIEDRPGLRAMMDPVLGGRLFYVDGVLPRVYLAQAAAVLPDFLAQRSVFAPEVLAGKQVILAPTPVSPASVAIGEPVAKDQGACRLIVFAHARIEAECQTTTPALAIFLEQFDQGWSARVDGQSTAVLRANLTMRAVPLQAGHHQIVLSFSPPGLRIGLAISIASLLVIVFALLFGRRRRPQVT
jgi:hypothetical protein